MTFVTWFFRFLGTLDALAVDGSEETKEKLFQMFDQIEKVLISCGRYVCITLLQEHILRAVIGWLQMRAASSFLFRIYKLKKEEDDDQANFKSFPVFVFVATKLKPKADPKRGTCLFELCLNDDYDSKPLRTLKEDTVLDLVKEVQNYNLIQNHIKNNSLEEELCFELFDSSDVNEFKYKFIVTEQFSRENKLKFAVFIVPINREKGDLMVPKCFALLFVLNAKSFSLSPSRISVCDERRPKRDLPVGLHTAFDFRNIECKLSELSGHTG